MRLKLNVKKCKFINKDAKPSEPIFSDFILLDIYNATLLGNWERLLQQAGPWMTHSEGDAKTSR